MSKKNHVTAPEPGQHHTKSDEILLQVYFSTSTLLQKIMSRHCPKNHVMAFGPILSKKNHVTAQPSWPFPKKIMAPLWQLAELGDCGDMIFFIPKNPGARKFGQGPDALVCII